MLELKIICQCGQKYKFDVEPVNGKVPFSVKCPVCNLDGTANANIMLAHRLATPPAPPKATAPGAAPASVPVPATPPPPPPTLRAASAPATVTSAAPPPPPPAIAPLSTGLTINRDTHATPATATPPADQVGGAKNAPPALGSARPFAVNAAVNPPPKTSFGMGLVGALIGAVGGSLVYFVILHLAGLAGLLVTRYLAIGVGALAGWLATLLSKGEGSKELAGITATLTVAFVIGAQYLFALTLFHGLRAEGLKEAQAAYANAVVEAKQVMEAVPTGSDAEIRRYLAKSGSEDGDSKVTPASISDDDVKDFRNHQLTDYQDLASGKITKQQYEEKNDIKTSESKGDEDSDDSTAKGLFLLLAVRRSNIFALAAAAGLAFKMTANN